MTQEDIEMIEKTLENICEKIHGQALWDYSLYAEYKIKIIEDEVAALYKRLIFIDSVAYRLGYEDAKKHFKIIYEKG